MGRGGASTAAPRVLLVALIACAQACAGKVTVLHAVQALDRGRVSPCVCGAYLHGAGQGWGGGTGGEGPGVRGSVVALLVLVALCSPDGVPAVQLYSSLSPPWCIVVCGGRVEGTVRGEEGGVCSFPVRS